VLGSLREAQDEPEWRAIVNTNDHTDGYPAGRAAGPYAEAVEVPLDGAARHAGAGRGGKRIWWAVAALAAATVAAVLAFTGRLPFVGRSAGAESAAPASKPPAKRDPVAVTVASVTPRPVQRAIPMVGTLQGFDQVTITPKVEGQVTAIYHDVGDVVHPGEPLLQVDRTNYENAVAEAEKALGAELAKLSLGLDDLSKQRPEVRKLPADVRRRLDRLDVKLLPAVIRAARSEQLALSQRDRLTKLGGNVTEEELERVRTEYDVAVANRRQAIVEAEATVAAARQRLAVLDTALQRLDDTTVVVPFPNDESLSRPGQSVSKPAASKTDVPPDPRVAQPDQYVVAKKLVVVGTMVRSFPSVPVFDLVRDYELKLMGSLPERYVGDVEQPVAGKPPQKVLVETEAYPQPVEGRVQVVSPVVDTASRTFPVEVRVPNPRRKLKAGSFAKARILAREETVVPTVPEEAIVPFAGVIKVFVVQDGKAHAVQVKPGVRLEIKTDGRTTTWVEATGDLPAGAAVVTSGHSQLAEGTPVRLRGGATEGK
jgi:membrane fusion protein, multidrug efflux system